MSKKLFLLTVIAIAAFVGCSNNTGGKMEASGTYAPNQTETAYIYIHGGYVGKAVAKTDDMGTLSVSLDEAFLPHTLAGVDIEADEWNEDNTTSYVSRGNTNYVAKYIEYNDKVYIAVATGTGFSYVEADDSGMAAGAADLEKLILKNQASMAAYYALVPAGKFKVLDGFGGMATAVKTTSYGGVTKKGSPGYWANGRTWIGNITAIETFIAENGVQFSLSSMERAKEEDSEGAKYWSVADVVTGATNSDFKEYMGLAQSAAGKLKTN